MLAFLTEHFIIEQGDLSPSSNVSFIPKFIVIYIYVYVYVNVYVYAYVYV